MQSIYVTAFCLHLSLVTLWVWGVCQAHQTASVWGTPVGHTYIYIAVKPKNISLNTFYLYYCHQHIHKQDSHTKTRI